MPQLAAVVERLWTLEGRAEPHAAPDPVLPDGRAELVLHFGDPFELVAEGGARTRQPAIIFAGQLASQLLLRPTGRIAILGVRFRPYGAASLIRDPQHRLVGAPSSVGGLAPDLERDLARVREAAPTLKAAAASVQRLLCRWIDPARVDARVSYAVRLIDRSGGRASIDRVADAAGITRRHLERRFLDQVGVTPKRLARIARFQRALQTLARADPSRPVSETAAACGYADQSHFVRDFGRLAGCPPSAHLLRDALLTGFFVSRA